jgi:hypothetical protein
MGKGGGSPPAPTPPGETAKADYGADVASAGFGMEHGTPNQFSPAGSVTFNKYGLPDAQLGNGQTVPGGQGISSVTTAFSPQFQGVFDTLTNKGGALASNLPTGFDPNINTEDLRKAYVHEGLGNVQPVWDREDKQFNVLMAERGQPIGGEIWNDQRDQIGESRNQFVEGLTDQAHQAAAADESRQFQLALAEHQVPFSDFANYYNAVQGMQAGLQGRDAPLVASGAPNVDVAGITRGYDQQRYNNWQAQNANSNAGLGMGISAISSFLPLMFSDERVKEDISEVGKTNDGQPIYRYRYKGEPAMQMGLLAGLVEKDHPEAVREFPGTDIKMVDYEKATEGAVKRKRA